MSTQEAWLAFLTVFIEFVGVLAWPSVVLVGILVLKRPLRDLFSRVRTFAYGEHKAEFSPAEQEVGSGEPLRGRISEGGAPVEHAGGQIAPINPLRSSAIARLEDQFSAELAGQSPEQANRTLLTALAKERIEKVFLLAYANIFGSQIHALQELIDRGGFASWDDAKTDWKSLKEHNQNFADWDIHRYLNFLKHFFFVETDEQGIRITEYGKSFLSFLNEQGLTRNRPN